MSAQSPCRYEKVLTPEVNCVILRPMNIWFRTTRLKKLCDSETAMTRKWGKPNVKKIGQRLFELQACGNLAAMSTFPAAHCHPLTGDRAGQFAVSLHSTWRLVFVSDHDPIPRTPDGGLDLSRVTAITITEVEDYHG